MILLADAATTYDGLSWTAIGVVVVVLIGWFSPIGGLYALILRLTAEVSALKILIAGQYDDQASNRKEHSDIYKRLGEHDVMLERHAQRLNAIKEE